MAAIDLDRRIRYQRWIAAVGLAAAAEDSARVDTPETRAMALLAAHGACEAALGLIAGVIREPKPGHDLPFAELVRLARERVSMAAGLVDHLTAMHRMRNAFVHASNSVDAIEAARATAAARQLLELASTHVLGREGGAGGVATAVADVIAIEPVGIWLRHADEMMAADQVDAAADACARALDEALSRATPALRTDRDLSARVGRAELDRLSAGLGFGRGTEKEVARRVEGLEAWVVPLALGIAPSAYADLRRSIGSVLNVDLGGHPQPVTRRQTITADDVRRAAPLVSAMVFRLWSMGSLRTWEHDDKLVELATGFLENERADAGRDAAARADSPV